VPTLCGAALRNISVQPVLDAICQFLPNPLERVLRVDTDEANSSSSRRNAARSKQTMTSLVSAGLSSRVIQPSLTGAVLVLAFKVTHDLSPSSLPIVYVRVFSGVLRVKDTVTISNASAGNRHLSRERVLRLLKINGADHKDVDSLCVGEIGAIVGLKRVFSGDTLRVQPPSLNDSNLSLSGFMRRHEPVFHASIEAANAGAQLDLDRALSCVQREDSSVSVTLDALTGQTVIGAQGELHMEIIAHRLLHDFKVKADLGQGASQSDA